MFRVGGRKRCGGPRLYILFKMEGERWQDDVTIVAVLIVFLIALAGCGTTEPTPDPDSNTPGEQIASERPAEKTITTFPEGMEETGTYRLLDWAELPFTTYVPIGMYEDMEAVEEEDARGVRIGPLEIVFFDAEVDEEQA